MRLLVAFVPPEECREQRHALFLLDRPAQCSLAQAPKALEILSTASLVEDPSGENTNSFSTNPRLLENDSLR
jgi:hypothetical protein